MDLSGIEGDGDIIERLGDAEAFGDVGGNEIGHSVSHEPVSIFAEPEFPVFGELFGGFGGDDVEVGDDHF